MGPKAQAVTGPQNYGFGRGTDRWTNTDSRMDPTSAAAKTIQSKQHQHSKTTNTAKVSANSDRSVNKEKRKTRRKQRKTKVPEEAKHVLLIVETKRGKWKKTEKRIGSTLNVVHSTL